MASDHRQPELIAQEPDFVIVNKPSGLLSIPDREGKDVSLKTLLKQRFGEIFTVHRLDRETSGIILFARNAESHAYYSSVFEEREVEKYYTGFVSGVPDREEGLIDEPLMENRSKSGTMIVHKQGKPSQTQFRVLESFKRYAFMEFRIFTGRMHQIRVHMKHAGHPVLCDKIYGSGDPIMLSSMKRNYKMREDELDEKPLLDRLALHAKSLAFKDMDGNERRFECPLPKDLRALHNQFTKWLV
jgi:23S rRNA pseudouridine1911/1915/1917 synthase